MSPLRLVSSVTPAGQRIHSVDFVNPGTPAPDGDGGYTQTTDTIGSGVRVAIQTATQRDLERIASGTVIAEASHIVFSPYLAGVTTQTRILFGAKTFHVVGVDNPDMRNRELVMAVSEVVT